MNDLNCESDGRSTDPDVDNRRKGRFRAGWDDAAVRGKIYEEETLKNLYWQNLGYRLGKLFGNTSDPLKEEIYHWCVKQQMEKEGND